MAQAVRSNSGSSASWELVAEQVATGKSATQCEARWRALGFRDYEEQQQTGNGSPVEQQGEQEQDLQVNDGEFPALRLDREGGGAREGFAERRIGGPGDVEAS